MREKALQKEIVDIARGQGWRVLHDFHPFMSDSGFPDLHMVHPVEKKVLIAELKAEGKNPREDQVEVLACYEAMGVPVFIWRPSDLPKIPEILASIAPPEWLKPGFSLT